MSASVISPRSISDIAWLLAKTTATTKWSVVFLLVFLAPGVFFSMVEVPIPYLVVAAFFERFAQLLVIGAVFIGAATLLPTRRVLKLTPRFLALGLSIELVIAIGAFLIVTLPGIGAGLAALALMIGLRTITAIVLYPMPFMDPLLSTREAFEASRALTAKTSLVTLALWPLAFATLTTGLAFSVYPDGRLWWSAPAAQMCAGLAHLIFVFRCAAASAIGTGLVVPAHGRQTFGSPKILLLSGLLLWGANLVRAYTLPPGPSLALIAVTATEQRIVVELQASDARYAYRGFTPQRFFIGGATGYPITTAPAEIKKEAAGNGVLADKTLRLTFSTERKASELAQIEDLHLWYGAVKISPIKILE